MSYMYASLSDPKKEKKKLHVCNTIWNLVEQNKSILMSERQNMNNFPSLEGPCLTCMQHSTICICFNIVRMFYL